VDRDARIVFLGRQPALPRGRHRNVMAASSELPSKLLGRSSCPTDDRWVGITDE
jgi:hypothetical protein